ncbi:MAG: cytochrome c3 family protein, partial [Proteobacteria bacterium]|nr:cytochrome c3 family protein [Pseudomonadota bacterium]
PDPTGGRPGVLSMRLLRPAKGEQVFFGPYDDVFPGPDTFNPLYQQSRYCAACHDGRFWGVQVYGEFAEWADSGYPAKNISCQSCHMKPDGKTTRVALEKEGSILRRPNRISSHTFTGREDLDFMRSAVKMEAQTQVERGQGKVTVRVVLSNTGTGHHLPSGNPMRNLILLVEAEDDAGRNLKQIAGSRVPTWGGEGAREKGNYAGLPGKGYAKVLTTPLLYPADRSFGDFHSPLYPAPHWRRVIVESDNRFPANGEDTSEYDFQLNSVTSAVQVRIHLLHRRIFRSWRTPEALPDGDLLLAEQSIRLPP